MRVVCESETVGSGRRGVEVLLTGRERSNLTGPMPVRESPRQPGNYARGVHSPTRVNTANGQGGNTQVCEEGELQGCERGMSECEGA